MASVRKRRWKGPDGEVKEAWVVQYTDQSGKQRLKTEKSKKDADKFRWQVEADLAAGDHLATGTKRTVTSLCEEFLRAQEDRQKDGRIGRGTLKLFRCEIDNSIVPYIGRLLVTSIKVTDVDDFYRRLVREGELMPATAKDRVQTLRQILRYGEKRGYLRREPVTEALRDLRGVSSATIRTFTKDELISVLAAAEQPRSPWKSLRSHALTRAAVHLAAFCGLRYGEIMGLTIGNLDLDGRYLRVRHSLTAFDELKAPKTRAGLRDVPLPNHLAVILREWLARLYVANPRQLVFRTENGTRIAPNSFHEWQWRPLLKRAGLEADDAGAFHFHALRHFAASWMIADGVAVTEVASLLGHKKFDTTLQTYAHPIVGGHQRHAFMDRAATGLLPVLPVLEGVVTLTETRQGDDIAP